MLLKAFGNIDATFKSDKTIVTMLDDFVETEIRKTLIAFAPEVGIVGEEQGAEGDTETFWLVDPIDGTENFVRGLTGTRNMVTLISDGQIVMTVVYQFMTDDLFTARRGGGAFKNGQPVHVSDRPASHSFVELSCPLDKQENAKLLQAVRGLVGGYRVSGDWLKTIEGKIDVLLAYNTGGGDWDYAPRALLMEEAGAVVGNIGAGLDGSTYDYKNHNFLAAAPDVFASLNKAARAVLA
jgi:myo-inositol-1(or 4)-monophosphatase